MSRQDEINLEFIINYGLLIIELRKAVLELESNGITSFLNAFAVEGVTEYINELEIDCLSYNGEILPAEKFDAETKCVQLGLVGKANGLKTELIKYCGMV